MVDQRELNIHWHESLLTRADRQRLLGARGGTVWLTGLPAAGKSTIAIHLERALVEQGVFAYRLDGDNIRHGLNKNLGFARQDRAENIRRIGEVAKLFADAGAVAITAFISPFAADRNACRVMHADSDLPFLEVFVDAPLDVCERRDPKGQYRMARRGELHGFTGVDDPYEAPSCPELTLETDVLTIEECVDLCRDLLERYELVLP